jgi:hypothetical protein
MDMDDNGEVSKAYRTRIATAWTTEGQDSQPVCQNLCNADISKRVEARRLHSTRWCRHEKAHSGGVAS